MESTLESRYGVTKERKKLPRWFWYAFATLATLIGIVFVAWVQHDRADAPEARDIGFELTSNDEASGTFELIKQPEDTAVCAVKALNDERAPVGWKEVTFGPTSPEDGKATVQTVTLRTLSEATTVTVDSCWLKTN